MLYEVITLKLLKPTLPSNIDFHFAVKTGNDIVLADPAQIHQLIMNLCTNAAWAMRGAGGRLDLLVGAHQVAEQGDALFQRAAPGDYVLLTVV